MIEAKELTKSFKSGSQQIEVLKKLSFNLKKGETAAVVGQSGAGKSTLLSLLAGLDFVDSGQLVVATETLKGKGQNFLAQFRAQNIGIVFQQYHLISHFNAIENVALPLEILDVKNALDKAMEMLQRVGLAHRATHFPHQLSGGECQRVAMARAIIARPQLILADEPSGNLDEKTGEKVIQLLFDLIEEDQMTALIVTHSRQLASRCKRLFVLHDGKIEEESHAFAAKTHIKITG